MKETNTCVLKLISNATKCFHTVHNDPIVYQLTITFLKNSLHILLDRLDEETLKNRTCRLRSMEPRESRRSIPNALSRWYSSIERRVGDNSPFAGKPPSYGCWCCGRWSAPCPSSAVLRRWWSSSSWSCRRRCGPADPVPRPVPTPLRDFARRSSARPHASGNRTILIPFVGTLSADSVIVTHGIRFHW